MMIQERLCPKKPKRSEIPGIDGHQTTGKKHDSQTHGMESFFATCSKPSPTWRACYLKIGGMVKFGRDVFSVSYEDVNGQYRLYPSQYGNLTGEDDHHEHVKNRSNVFRRRHIDILSGYKNPVVSQNIHIKCPLFIITAEKHPMNRMIFPY